ncbi:UNKNOWN [Stylonychia lemnae]|uniref:Uncharacterized protein n=1 Tax=Stylonychia lemnae TaxID=5949 RepID=A0A078A490_STYLE|nr:UNKNOWN [Stylonychia lemnae]|eukprot:CDW76709.1 UNKNOWN [Stylonychia lemnae]
MMWVQLKLVKIVIVSLLIFILINITIQVTTYNVVSCASNKTDAFCAANAQAPKSCCANITTTVINSQTLAKTYSYQYYCLPYEFVFYQITPFVISNTTSYTYDCGLSNLTASTVCSLATTQCGTNNCCMQRSGSLAGIVTQFRGLCQAVANEGTIIHNPTTPAQTNLIISSVCMSNSGNSGGSGGTTTTNTSTGSSSGGTSGIPVGGYGTYGEYLQSTQALILFLISFLLTYIMLE